jgi:hypothetical protein
VQSDKRKVMIKNSENTHFSFFAIEMYPPEFYSLYTDLTDNLPCGNPT